MKMTERAVYLSVILGLILFGVERIDWFSSHYDELNKELGVLSKVCRKNGINIDVCELDDTGKCKK